LQPIDWSLRENELEKGRSDSSAVSRSAPVAIVAEAWTPFSVRPIAVTLMKTAAALVGTPARPVTVSFVSTTKSHANNAPNTASSVRGTR
jgi:hypothetical protein